MGMSVHFWLKRCKTAKDICMQMPRPMRIGTRDYFVPKWVFFEETLTKLDLSWSKQGWAYHGQHKQVDLWYPKATTSFDKRRPCNSHFSTPFLLLQTKRIWVESKDYLSFFVHTSRYVGVMTFYHSDDKTDRGMYYCMADLLFDWFGFECYQMVRLFFSIWPFATMKISPIMSRICQIRNKLSKICQILVNFCQSGEILPTLVTLVYQRTPTLLGEVSLYGRPPGWLVWIWPEKKNCWSFIKSKAADSKQNNQEVSLIVKDTSP